MRCTDENEERIRREALADFERVEDSRRQVKVWEAVGVVLAIIWVVVLLTK